MTRTHKWMIIDKTHADYSTINTAVQSSMSDVSNHPSVFDNNDNTRQCVKIDVTQAWWNSQTWTSSPAVLVEMTNDNTGFQTKLDENNFVEPTQETQYIVE